MITQVEVVTPAVTSSPLPYLDGNPSTDPIQIHKIDGLGPVVATVNTSQYGSIDGEYENGSNRGKRNIVLTVGLNPDWANQSVESLRQILYAYFMPKNKVTLKFTSTHMGQVSIDGTVESLEPDMFSKDPEYQISVICPKPDFIATAATVVTGVVGSLPDTAATNIDYQGTSPTGFQLDVTDLGGASPDLNGELRFAIGVDNPDLFIATPVKADSTTSFRVSTVAGNKYAHQVAIPGGAETSVLGKVVPGSAWMQLKQGLNAFRVMSAAPAQAWSMQYFARYGGL